MLKFVVVFISVAAFTKPAITLSHPTQERLSELIFDYEREDEPPRPVSEVQVRQIIVALRERASTAELVSKAKRNLPQEPEQAIATPRAALAEKGLAYSILQERVDEIHAGLEAEVRQYQLAVRAANTAKEAAHTVEAQVQSLTETLQRAKSAVEQARTVVKKGEAILASQTSMVNEAREHYRDSTAKLQNALEDFEATKEAAEKASDAAEEARANVSRARSGESR